MTLLQPIWMQHTGGDAAVDYAASELRDLVGALLRSEGVLLPSIAGAAGALKVTQRGAGANFSVDVAAGRAAVLGDDVADQGHYLIRSTAVENVVTPAAPGSGTRVHRVVAQVRDKFHNGSWTTYDWLPLLLEDTGSGTPATPASALNLARVSITAGQLNVSDANITDDRFGAQLLNGPPSTASADSNRPLNPFTPETIWRSDKGCFETAVSGLWYEHRPGELSKAKPSNETVTSSVAFQDDDHLQLTTPPVRRYELSACLFYSAHQDADFKIEFSGPTNSYFDYNSHGQQPGTTGGVGSVNHEHSFPGFQAAAFGGHGPNNTATMSAVIRGHYYSGDGGTFKLRWAQNASHATGTILRANSYLVLRPITL